MARIRGKWAAWVVPGAVYQSVIVGGGYGTGREVVEFISSSGPTGGLYALALICALNAMLIGVTFEFARIFQCRDYRSLFENLAPKLAPAYETVFLVGLLLILAVAASACGNIVSGHTGAPGYVGAVLFLAIVTALTALGRTGVTRVLTLFAVITTMALTLMLIHIATRHWDAILHLFTATGEHPTSSPTSWWPGATTFFLYNAILIPVILYSTDGIITRRDSVIAACFAAVMGIFPGLIFHTGFMAHYPAILDEALPTYYTLRQMGLPALEWIYIVLLFGTLTQTGVGALHGFTERLDRWFSMQRGIAPGPLIHSGLAAILITLSLALSLVGVIELIAKGYGALSVLGLFVYVIPILTIGFARLKNPPIAD